LFLQDGQEYEKGQERWRLDVKDTASQTRHGCFALRSDVAGTLYSVRRAETEPIHILRAGQYYPFAVERGLATIANNLGRARTSRHASVAGGCQCRIARLRPVRPIGENEIKPETTNAALPHADKVLEEFQPHLLKQHEGRLFVKYDNFSAAVEDFFSHLVNQKRLQKAQAAESNAIDKLERVSTDLQDRVVALEQDQEELQEHARWCNCTRIL
jgi:hypothetical protein